MQERSSWQVGGDNQSRYSSHQGARGDEVGWQFGIEMARKKGSNVVARIQGGVGFFGKRERKGCKETTLNLEYIVTVAGLRA